MTVYRVIMRFLQKTVIIPHTQSAPQRLIFPNAGNTPPMETKVLDGNGAVAHISYAFSEIAVVYPITPASPMAELVDEWAEQGKRNLFGEVPKVAQMQSEAGAAGALHGALVCGAIATSYTCSQGLLLMLPDTYKIAGELLPCVVHVSARALSTHALSIFGDHQDVMACRQSGFAILSASTVQESHDFALVAQLATLRASVPFLHVFDGFRTSHEKTKIDCFEEEELKALLPREEIQRFRERALSPDAPTQLGTAQNSDIYFQNREAANARYLALPALVQSVMDEVERISGRRYRLFDYFGSSTAEHILVLMGSACSTAEETVEYLLSEGAKVGIIKVRLYRPFDGEAFSSALPLTAKTVSVLDRTKEAGALGEPLYLDVCAALKEQGRGQVCVYGGRYGLGGKEFTPAHVVAVFENAKLEQPKNHFTVGIEDDVTHTSLPVDSSFRLPFDGVACKFYGLGSDGTVGANKNSISVIGENTPLYVQGYFCYDSRKSGGVTVSHLRFGKSPIRAAYLIDSPDFVACHNPSYLARYDMLRDAKEGGVFLLNCPWQSLADFERRLPASVKNQIAEKHLRFFVVDATRLAEEIGLRGRTSTIMQAAFFYLNPEILPYERAKRLLLAEIERKFSSKGTPTVEMNRLCIEKAEERIREIFYPRDWATTPFGAEPPPSPKDGYFERFMQPILSLQGDSLPVSAFAEDGRTPTNTSRLEKHGVPAFLPKWLPENCIQCNRCAFVCPHACIRPFLFEETLSDLTTLPAVGIKNACFRIQASALDCMGCGVCARTCPAKEKALVMTPSEEIGDNESKNWELCLSAPPVFPTPFKRNTVKGSQFYPPLFEFSYACSGCGETPYIKLLTQLFGEKTVIANATGCSSIYGGSAPVCPYAKNADGRGPAWASSLFEDNAEFGYGMRLALSARKKEDKSTWIIGGDGWAYDIGYGGLDHVLASGENVNILVLDSEVYSNTGGQSSKATPLGAVARFAAKGKRKAKKDLGLMALTYGDAYIAQIAMGANMQQTVNALTEAEAYEGVSLIIAYTPCIAHGVYMGKSMEEEKLAVESGYFPLYRYNPALRGSGKAPFILDSKPPKYALTEFLEGENRFMRLKKERPQEAKILFDEAEKKSREKYRLLEKLAEWLG